MSARLLLPWETRVSRLAGLPTDRAAWLAIVLPPLLTEPSHPRATAALAAAGIDLPRWTLAGWAAKLAALHAAGLLPEAPDGIPERRPSGRAWRASAGVPVESRGPRSAPAPKRTRKAAKRTALTNAGLARLAHYVETAGLSTVATAAGLSPATLRNAIRGRSVTLATRNALVTLADRLT